MTGTRDYLHHNSSIFSPNTMKLASSASEQNVYFTYVCLVNDIKPSGTSNLQYGPSNKAPLNVLEVLAAQNEEVIQEGQPIQVERSKALHELVESYRKAEQVELAGEQNETDSSTPYPTTTSGEDSEFSENDESNFLCCDNPNVLKLTKMKWLTENQNDSPDSSSPSLSPSTSSSNCSKVSEDDLTDRNDFEDKYLSTILRLDKEHNMFGLSNIAIVGAKASKAKRNDDERAVFHQTAIVQICCGRGGCKHKSNTDLPASLKCGGCLRCCSGPYCQRCVVPHRLPCSESPCQNSSCTSCVRSCNCKLICTPCPSVKCMVDSSFGLKIKLNRKQKYEPGPIELTPRSSSVLHKPLAARSCHHWPHCVPPSSCYPYLMPCFWPARASAPCSVPTRCFHNPPCPAARKRIRVPIPKEYICPRNGPCENSAKGTKCENDICPGNNPVLRGEIEKRFGTKS